MCFCQGTKCSKEYAKQLREDVSRNVTAVLLRVVVVIILDWDACNTLAAAVMVWSLRH